MNSTETSEIPTSQQRSNRRRRYIVSPAFQWKYAATITLTVLLISSLLSIGLYGVLQQQARLRTANPVGYHADVGRTIVLSALGFAALTSTGVGLWWLVITRRFCGPLSVMGRWLEELGAGRVPNVRPLRRNDEFEDFYVILSSTVDSLKANKQAELTAFTQALEVAHAAAEGDEETLRSTVSSLSSLLESCQKDAASALGVHLEPSRAGPAGEPQSATSGRCSLRA